MYRHQKLSRLIKVIGLSGLYEGKRKSGKAGKGTWIIMEKDSELKFTYTGILHNKKGEKVVRVCFEKQGEGGRKFAEGVLPEGKIDASFGFSDEEITKLEEYLQEYSADIMHKAREITGITHWLK